MVYVHIPFCKSFCTYCDFYSEICSERVQNLFLESLFSEIESRRDEILLSNEVRTLYFGGGTPSLLSAGTISEIAGAIDNGPYDEFTVEVNPDDIVSKGVDYVRELKKIGVNRISMGVQSFDDSILKWMNRRHTAGMAEEAIDIIRRSGIENISLDLIFGISQLGDELWERTLDKALSLRPEHISAYQLSIEEGSALHTMIEDGRYVEADEEKCRRQYEILCRKLSEAGYHHYEISNFALPGKEAVHNSAYWQRKPYVGLGPGAHSLKGENVRSWNSQQLYGWTSECETLSEEEIREETLMLGLRTDKGAFGMVIPESKWFVSDDIICNLISEQS